MLEMFARDQMQLRACWWSSWSLPVIKCNPMFAHDQAGIVFSQEPCLPRDQTNACDHGTCAGCSLRFVGTIVSLFNEWMAHNQSSTRMQEK